MSAENPVSSSKQSSSSEAANDDILDSEFSHRGCCFWLPFTTNSSTSTSSYQYYCWERIGGLDHNGGDNTWIITSWKKLREWSELVAGPKWKTFIRRFGKNRNGFNINNVSGISNRQGKFGYDPLSYSLNFDEGQKNGNIDEDIGFRDFSYRYASIPASAKSSMDLGKDGPSFL